MKNTFKKYERLTNVRVIDGLFRKDTPATEAFLAYPLRVVYQRTDATAGALPQVLVSVPKRRLKKAVDRNQIKRRIREAYRLNKELLPPNPPTYLVFSYVANEVLPYETIEKSMKKAFSKLGSRG